MITKAIFTNATQLDIYSVTDLRLQWCTIFRYVQKFQDICTKIRTWSKFQTFQDNSQACLYMFAKILFSNDVTGSQHHVYSVHSHLIHGKQIGHSDRLWAFRLIGTYERCYCSHRQRRRFRRRCRRQNDQNYCDASVEWSPGGGWRTGAADVGDSLIPRNFPLVMYFQLPSNLPTCTLGRGLGSNSILHHPTN